MSQNEQDPSREGRQPRAPEINFWVENSEVLEQLAWNKASDQVVFLKEDSPPPLAGIRVSIDGSSEERGPYTIRSVINLNDFDYEGADPNSNRGEFFHKFAQENYSQSADEDHMVYHLTTDRGHNYLLHVSEEDFSVITIETAGSDGIEDPLERRVLRRLMHGEHNFDAALWDHLELTSRLLKEMYRFYGEYNVSLKFVLPQPETTDEDESNLPPEIYRPKVNLDDLGGMQNIKDQLLHTVLSLQNPEILDAWQVDRPHGIFLHGPPGTGKTTLAEAVAKEVGALVHMVKSSDIYGKWMGESESRFQAIIEQARQATRPYVLLFDEVDGIIRESGGSAYSTVATLFKQEIGRLSEQNPNVIVIATSNKTPGEIDEALFRAGRFDTHIFVPLPDPEGRRSIFGSIIGRRIMNSSSRAIFDMDIDLRKLAEETDGLSGADINEIIRKTLASKAVNEIMNKKSPRAVTTSDLLVSITNFKTSKS